jgi:hypothetical protein
MTSLKLKIRSKTLDKCKDVHLWRLHLSKIFFRFTACKDVHLWRLYS